MKALSESNIILHGVLCCLLFIAGLLFDSDCLKVLHAEGLALGISSKLLILDTNISKRLIWVFPVIIRILYNNYTRLNAAKDLENLDALKYSYFIILTALSVVVHSIILCVPIARPAWKSSNIAVVISSYSLEIYVVHILILFIVQQYFYDKYADFVYK